MQLSKKNLYLGGIIVVLILLYMNFFYLIEGFGYVDHLYWPFILVVCAVLAIYVDPKSYILYRRYSRFINSYTIGAIVSLFIVYIGTLIVYGQSLTRTFREVFPYSMFLIAIPMVIYIVRNNTTNCLINILNTIALFWYLLIILQQLLYLKGDTIIFSSSFEYEGRNGIRMSLSCIGNLAIIINCHQLLFVKKKNRGKFSKLICVLGLYALIVIQQTRALTFAILLCIFIMILLDSRKQINKFLRKWLLLIAAVTLVMSTGAFDSFLESFSKTGELAHSTIVREEAIDYYISIFKSNPLFGFGFVGVADFNSLIRGPYGSYFLNDVGIFGQLAKLGIFIVPIYVWPVIRFIKIAYQTKQSGYYESFVLLTVLCVYILVTSVSVIMIDSARSIGMPIYIALFEYQNYLNKKTVTRKITEYS